MWSFTGSWQSAENLPDQKGIPGIVFDEENVHGFIQFLCARRI